MAVWWVVLAVLAQAGPEAAAEEPARELPGSGRDIGALAFAPEGERLAYGDDAGRVRVCDLAGGSAKALLGASGEAVQALAFTPDGEGLAAGTDAGRVHVWSLAEETEVLTLDLGEASVNSVAFDRAGELFVVTGSEVASNGAAPPQGEEHYHSTASFWSATGEALGDPWVLDSWVHDAALSADGARFALGDDLGGLYVLDRDRDRPRDPVEVPGAGEVFAVALSPDATTAAAGTDTGEIWLIDLDGPRAPRRLAGHRDAVFDLAFPAPGDRLVSAAFDLEAREWDLEAARTTRVLRGHLDALLAVAASPGGAWIATAGMDDRVLVWGPREAGWAPVRHAVRKVAAGSARLEVPACFSALGPEEIESFWPEELRPAGAWGNDSRTVVVSLAVLEPARDVEPSFAEACAERWRRAVQVERWIANEEVERKGRSWARLELIEDDGQDLIHHELWLARGAAGTTCLDLSATESAFPAAALVLHETRASLVLAGD